MQKLKVNTPNLKVNRNGTVAAVLLDTEPPAHLLSAFHAMTRTETVLATTRGGNNVLLLLKRPTLENYQEATELAMQFNSAVE